MNDFTLLHTSAMNNDFVTDPASLLESKDAIVIDAISLIETIKDAASSLFMSPDQGVYTKSSIEPIMRPYDVLYTHKETHEFFPEIGSPVFSTNASGLSFRTADSVGQKINWRQAIENNINVYSRSGRLLLKATDSRNNFIFNPTPTLFASRFVLDIAEFVLMESTNWGNTESIQKNIEKYKLEEVEVEKLVSFAIGCGNKILKPISDFVKKDPWLIYTANIFGSNILIESSCDYRHFKCNEALWNQRHTKDKDDDLLETFRYVPTTYGPIRYDDLEEFFSFVRKELEYNVQTLEDLFEMLEKTKLRPWTTIKILNVFDKFIEMNKSKVTQSTRLINKLVSNKNGNNSINFDTTSRIHFL